MMLTHPDAFALVTATHLQRAICRVSDGLPLDELWEDEAVREAFGHARPPETAPAIMGVFCAIRTAKSTMAAAKVVLATQSCDLSHLSPGDLVEVPVLAPTKDRALAVFNHIVENVRRSPLLSPLLVGEPTADTLYLRHPSGRPIRVKVTALSKHGSTVIGSWLAGAVFDEAPRMAGEQDGVLNLTESLGAIRGRMLPGAQIWLIGSPYAPFGPVYDLDAERFGKPAADVVVIRAPGPAMNPYHFTPEFCERLKNEDPKAYRTDVLALFADPEESLFSSVDVENAQTIEGDLEPQAGVEYVAAMDPATRGNAWTLVILGCYGRGGPGGLLPAYKVALRRQWIGSKAAPLSPDKVIEEATALCAPYGVSSAFTDQYSIDALRDIGDRHGFGLVGIHVDAKNRLEMAKNAALQVRMGCLELPKDNVFRGDLLAARVRVTINGVTLVLPRSGDGRHCDYLPSLMLALHQPPPVPEAEQSKEDIPEGFEAILDAQDGDSLSRWEEVVQGVCGAAA